MWQITTTTVILGMLLVLSSSMNVNGLSTSTRTQQQNQQHDQWTSMKTMDFLSSSSSRGRNRQLQEAEVVTTTTSEFPVLISEIPMEERMTTVYNSSEIPPDTLADVVIYGCTPAGLFTALRLLDPSLTQDTIREDVATEGTNLTVVIMEPSNRCGGRLLTAQYSDEFLAELGDLGYFSSGKSYSDVIMEYFNLETKSLDVESTSQNMLYLRGRHSRASGTANTIEEIYRNMNFVERGQSASDLLMYAVDMLLPGAFDLNETEWNSVFMEASMGPSEDSPQGTNAYRLTKMGFWNALSQVLSHDACDLVTTYYQDMLMIKSNMNALEAIVTIVQTMSLAPNLKTPVLGMESIVWELYSRVLELGGFITLDAIMTDLIPTGTIDPLTNSSAYDITFEVTSTGNVIELTDVSSVIMAATPDSFDHGTESDASSAAYRLVSLQSDFFLLEDNATNTTDMIDLNVTLSNGTTSTTTSDRLLYPEPTLTIQNTVLGNARMPIHYARIYMCYDAPWWKSLKIQNGRSVTDLPINSVVYFSEDACLTICANGVSSMYWKQLANAGGNMFMPTTMKEELMVDFTVWETRWDDLADSTPVGVIEEAQRQLKLLHDLPYLPMVSSAIFITDETLEGNSQYQTIPGINPYDLSQFMMKPRSDWNVFFVGEAFGTGFPHKGLEADFVSAENLIQQYFYTQPEPFTFDSTGELTSDQLMQTGLAVASSADGSRIAVVSSSPSEETDTTIMIGEVTVYQRIGDEFLGLWKSMGTNFVSDKTSVDLTVGEDETVTDKEVIPDVPEVEVPVVNETEVPEVPVTNETEVVVDEEVIVDTTSNTTDLGNTTRTRRATRRRLSTSTWDSNMYNAPQSRSSSSTTRNRRRKLVDRTEMSNLTSVALSGDGRIMAISIVNMESTSGTVQLWKDSSLSGNWTKIGQSLFEEDGEFGFSISLSYDGSVLAVGAPSADDFGAVKVYDCSQVIRGSAMKNINDMLQPVNSEGPSAVADDVRETFAPATGLLSTVGATSLMSSGGKGSSSSSSTSGLATCIQMGKTMEGIDVVTRYGESVSLSYDGRAVAAGAPNTGLTPAEVGYASVFAFDSDQSDWIQVGSLLMGDEALDQFGFSVSISAEGRYVAVGAPAMSTGYAKVYEYVEEDWAEVLSTNDSAATEAGSVGGDNIGYSVALSGNGMRFYVGAPQIDVDREGYVLALMQETPGNWTLAQDSLETLKGIETGDAMGYSVATDYMGSNIALGAPQSSTGGQGLVRTYVFVEPPPSEDEVVVTETVTVTEPVMEVPFEGSTSEETTTARLIWSDAESSLKDHPPYPWEDNEPCVEGPLLIYPDFLPAAINALGAAMTAALGDARLTSEVEAALLINMELNEPMVEESCTPLLEAAQMLADDGLIEDRVIQVLLERAIAAYEAGAGETTLIPGNETAVETNETSVVVGNETDVPAVVPVLELNATELVNRTVDGSGRVRRDLLAHGRIGTSSHRPSHRRATAGHNQVSMKKSNHHQQKKEDTGSYLSRFRLF